MYLQDPKYKFSPPAYIGTPELNTNQSNQDYYMQMHENQTNPQVALTGLSDTLLKPGESILQYNERMRLRKQTELDAKNSKPNFLDFAKTAMPWANVAVRGFSEKYQLNQQDEARKRQMNDENYNPTFSSTVNDYGIDENQTFGQGTFQDGGEQGDNNSADNEFDAYDFLFNDDDSDRITETDANEEEKKVQELENQRVEDNKRQENDLVTQQLQLNQNENQNYENNNSSQNYTKNVNTNVGNNEEFAYNYYKSQGIPDHVAAGIVGNLSEESNVKALNHDDGANGPGGGGVAQWSPERYSKLKSWARQSGKDPNALKTQLDYILVEASQRGDLQKTMNTQNAAQAATVFGKTYLRPANQYLYNGARQSKATNIVNKFQSGGEYDLSHKEILELMAKGYKINML